MNKIEEIITECINNYKYSGGDAKPKEYFIEELNTEVQKKVEEAKTVAFWNGVEMQINNPLSYSQFQKERKHDLSQTKGNNDH